MSINISSFAGAGAQFSDANGAPLSGGLIYTYEAGTTTNAVTFTSRTGLVNNTNPIVLDSAGRTPAEIWLTGGSLYKFVLKDSAFVQIGSYDNIPAINDVTTVSNLITVAGTNTLTGLGSPAVVAYTAGSQYSFLPQNNNTGAVTINIDTLGAKSITKFGTVPLTGGEIVAGSFAIVEYDGTRFQLINPNPVAIPSIKTGNFTAATFNTYAVNTTAGAITATLPASPVAGDNITFIDYAKTYALNNLTIAPNGNKINSSTNNVILSVSGAAASLVYVDATQGWLCYSGFVTNPTTNYSVNYLVVAGGGGGGATAGGGGGGGGGLLTSSTTFSTGTAYSITVGSGGPGSSVNNVKGTNGVNSSIAVLVTAIGGGGGSSNNTASAPGSSGGSGGGGADAGSLGGSGTLGQGNAGGNGASGPVGGGGGGAAAVGVNAVAATSGGNGGAGSSSSISGSALNYAGGGGGGGTIQGTGGVGGGGTAGNPGGNGTANTGGGGGGGGTPGGNGGSGIVIISYVGTQRGTGGTVTTSGGNTIHTFTSSSTYNA
jgi:hypothetical protein